MRYAIGILLLASPAFAGEPVYSWQSRADDPDRIYLYRDGQQIGGWCYKTRHYRPYDGRDWGSATAAAPVQPPVRLSVHRSIVLPPQTLPPIVVTQPLAPLPRLRGPLSVRLGTAMGLVMTDMFMKVIEEIPRAIVASFLGR